MLVQVSSRELGVAVQSWLAGENKIFYVLIPYVEEDGRGFVQVDASPESEVMILGAALNSWGALAKDIEGYREAVTLARQLYCVFDDGPGSQPRYAAEIYDVFKNIIIGYRKPALEYLEKQYANAYRARLTKAKEKGWEIVGIEKRKAIFPYPAKEYSGL